MSEPSVLRIGGGLLLLRNHAIIDLRGRLLMRLQLVSDADAVRVFDALVFCGALEDGDG